MGKRVLVVDDDSFMRETVSDILSEKGYEAVPVESGFEAIEKMKESLFDIVLLDLKMDGMDGYETYLELKKLNARVKAIITTAYYEDETIKQCLREGAFGILNKPLNMDDLVTQIEMAENARVIMIAEDDKNMREGLADILCENNFHVVSVCDREEALKNAKKVPPHVLVLDMIFPNESGYDIFRSVKDMIPSVKTVIITGYPEDTQSDVNLCLNNGADHCLYKPFDADQLVETVKEFF